MRICFCPNPLLNKYICIGTPYPPPPHLLQISLSLLPSLFHSPLSLARYPPRRCFLPHDLHRVNTLRRTISTTPTPHHTISS
ncbi:hypothetical protein QJS10_CPB14g01351 [Acorus calamus]|uniref:Uncharacterized protein n=1 Tax=Acorus calamus TaxID=4465 RepID=A0AAV9DAE2_ACOCL|nr:hypothetical protein QJS10_CPB14g01351 [Acorus calamus]